MYLDRRNLNLRLDGKRLVIEESDARPRGVPGKRICLSRSGGVVMGRLGVVAW